MTYNRVMAFRDEVEALIGAGCRQHQIAAHMGVNQSTVSGWARGSAPRGEDTIERFRVFAREFTANTNGGATNAAPPDSDVIVTDSLRDEVVEFYLGKLQRSLTEAFLSMGRSQHDAKIFVEAIVQAARKRPVPLGGSGNGPHHRRDVDIIVQRIFAA